MEFVKKYLPFFLLLILMFPPSYYSEIIPITITIANQMKKRLNVSCRQDGIDVGNYTLKPAQVWTYKDVVNTNVGTGQFECELNAARRHGHFVLFDFFRDLQHCLFAKLCYWGVRFDGLYLFYDHQFNLVSRWPA